MFSRIRMRPSEAAAPEALIPLNWMTELAVTRITFAVAMLVGFQSDVFDASAVGEMTLLNGLARSASPIFSHFNPWACVLSAESRNPLVPTATRCGVLAAEAAMMSPFVVKIEFGTFAARSVTRFVTSDSAIDTH